MNQKAKPNANEAGAGAIPPVAQNRRQSEEMGQGTSAVISVPEKMLKACGQGKRDEELEKDLANRFTYHAPKPGQSEIYEGIREMGKQFAILIARYTPKCREQSLAFTHIEEAVYAANAAVARH